MITYDAVSYSGFLQCDPVFVQKCMDFHGVKKIPHIRTHDDGLQAFFSDLFGLVCSEPSLTQQQFADECDINKILERVALGANPDEFFTKDSPVGDVDITSLPSNYKEALDQVTHAQSLFNSLPAKLRSRFDNDASKFVSFCTDSRNLEEMYSLGLARPVETSLPSEGIPKPAEGKPAPKAPSKPSSSSSSDDD